MVGQLVSGPSVAFEIVTDSEDTPTKFRQFVGPVEPVSVIIMEYYIIISVLF